MKMPDIPVLLDFLYPFSGAARHLQWGGGARHTEGPLTSQAPPPCRFSPRISATSFCKYKKRFFFKKNTEKTLK